MPAFDPRREELVDLSPQVRSGVVDPAGVTQARGVESAVHLDRHPLGRPYVRWHDMVLEVDVYPAAVASLGGGPGLEILLLCPKCSTPEVPHQLRITSDRKAIAFAPKTEIDPETGMPVMRGELSVEPFGCTWEEAGSDRRKYGLSLCNWKVGIDKNIARDA